MGTAAFSSKRVNRASVAVRGINRHRKVRVEAIKEAYHRRSARSAPVFNNTAATPPLPHGRCGAGVCAIMPQRLRVSY